VRIVNSNPEMHLLCCSFD